MNPYKLKNVFQYLTSNNQLLKKKLKLGTSEIPIPPKRSDVTTIEAINRFNKANPRVDATNLKPISVKQSNNSFTPKLFNAEPKKTGCKEPFKYSSLLNLG